MTVFAMPHLDYLALATRLAVAVSKYPHGLREGDMIIGHHDAVTGDARLYTRGPEVVRHVTSYATETDYLYRVAWLAGRLRGTSEYLSTAMLLVVECEAGSGVR